MKKRFSAVILIALILFSLCASLVSNAPVIAAPRSQDNPGTTGLVSWWEMEEASGTRVDSHGSNDLTDNNTVGQTAGIISNAASFVAANYEYLSIASNDSLKGNAAGFTVCTWTKPDSNASGTNHAIVGKWLDWRVQVYFTSTTSGNLELYMNDGGYKTVSGGTITSGNWYFICAWYDPTNTRIGISVNAGTPAYTTTSAPATSTEPFRIASTHNAGTTEHYNGLVDDTLLYAKTLTTSEIAWLYNAGAGRSYADLTAPEPTNTPTITNTPAGTLTPTPTITITPLPTNTPEAAIIATLPSTGQDYLIYRTATFGDVGTFVALIAVCILLVVLIWLELHPQKRMGRRGKDATDI